MQVREVWGAGEPYERYVGRWSRLVAREFLGWLDVPRRQTWGDVGCGTGALTAGVLAAAEPRAVLAVDRSAGFLAAARGAIPDRRVQYATADARALPWASACCAATVAGLVLNFVPDPAAAVREMVRVTRSGGQVAAYVWDYGGGMQMMRHFWDAAVALSPAAAALDQGERFPLCQPEPLRELFHAAGLTAVAVRPITIDTVFRDFDDYWQPFLGGQGGGPTFVASLDAETRDRLRDVLRARLVGAADRSIALSARAWAVRGVV